MSLDVLIMTLRQCTASTIICKGVQSHVPLLGKSFPLDTVYNKIKTCNRNEGPFYYHSQSKLSYGSHCHYDKPLVISYHIQ